MVNSDPNQLPPNPLPNPPPRRGGGCLIAAGLLIGPVVGVMFGETSIGLFAGLGLGIVAAIGLTLADWRR